MLSLIVRSARLAGRDGLWDVALDGEKIHAVVPHPLRATAPTELQGHGCLLSPGFVNAHHHLDKAMIVDKHPFQGGGILERVAQVRGWKQKATAEEVCAKALPVLRWSVATGVTALRTNVDVDPTWGVTGVEGLLAARQACRSVLDVQVAAFAQEGVLQHPQVPDLLRRALRMGADVVGGHTSIEPEPGRHMDVILDIAREFGVPAEFHVDEPADPNNMQLLPLIEKVKTHGWGGRTNALHCLALARAAEAVRREAAKQLADSGVHVTVCPTIVTFGLPVGPARELSEMGVTVACGSDNLRDPFNPLGEVAPVRLASLLALLDGFYTETELTRLFKIITCGGATVLALPDYGEIAAGQRADLVLLDGPSPAEVIRAQASVRWVLKAGRPVWSTGMA